VSKERNKERWHTVTLPDLAENLDRRRVPLTKADRTSGPHPYYGASGIVDYVEGYLFEGDTLLISEDGANLLARSTPIAFPATGKYWVNNHAHILRFESGVTQRLVELYLESIPLDSYITGTAQPKLNQSALNSIPITIPVSLQEQERLVRILDEALEGIATAQSHAVKQTANAHAIFEAQLTQTFRQLQAGDNTSVMPLSMILSEQPRNGWSPPAEYQTGTGMPVLTLSSVTGFVYDGSRVKMSSAPTNDNAHYWLREGELLITRSNTIQLVGHVAIYDGTPKQAICCDLIMKMKVNPKKALTRFVYYCLRSADMRDHISSRAQGANATMSKIGKSVVQNIPITVPSLSSQEAIVQKLDETLMESDRLASVQRMKLQRLKELKQSLLHEAFSGKL